MSYITSDTCLALEVIKAPKPQLRERIALQGVSSLSDIELIAVLLGTGTHDMPVMSLAEHVLDCLVQPHEESTTAPLESIMGMGLGKSATIKAALELGKRFYGTRGTIIEHPNDFVPLVHHYRDKRQEHFLCASLNGGNEVMNVRLISIGTVNRTVVHPREVFCEAIIECATSVIICHNHPSGQLIPSACDITITEKIQKAGEIIGIPLLDHIIISTKGFFSFKEEGLLDALPVSSQIDVSSKLVQKNKKKRSYA